MNIVLLGYRGCGKTSVGRLLAERLNMTFVDIDRAICDRFGGRDVAEIWNEEGEPAYRAVEVDVTTGTMRRDGQVVALGGGTLMQPDARAAIERTPDTRRIYLHAPPEVLYARVQNDSQSPGHRPNLTDKGGGLEEIRDVLAEREPVYLAVADEVVEVDAVSVEAIVQRLARSVTP